MKIMTELTITGTGCEDVKLFELAQYQIQW